jgi:hypothetical protein
MIVLFPPPVLAPSIEATRAAAGRGIIVPLQDFPHRFNIKVYENLKNDKNDHFRHIATSIVTKSPPLHLNSVLFPFGLKICTHSPLDPPANHRNMIPRKKLFATSTPLPSILLPVKFPRIRILDTLLLCRFTVLC